MYILRLLLAVFLVSEASAVQAEPRVSIGFCGDADIQLEFKGATAKHLLIEELRVAMEEKSVAKFAYNSIDGTNSSFSLYLRDRRTNALLPVPTDDYNTLRCIEKRGETYLMMAAHCGGSGCNPYGSQLFSTNRWRYLTHKGETSIKQVHCEWQCLVRVLGPAFEVEEDAITILLETGDPVAFNTPPKKKRRHPAETLPKGKECEMIISVFEECVYIQRERCSKQVDFGMSLSSVSRGNYYAIAGLNTKFDTVAFENACQSACRAGGKALTTKAITAKFCG
ncbi:MAG: hypothetical protein ABIZ64_01605 [Casimicrobium sp.]|jgi:hypothetical protein